MVYGVEDIMRCRSRLRRICRFVGLIDNQAALSVLVKGRSSAVRMNRVLRRVNGFVLAGQLYGAIAWVVSDLNPAHRPSTKPPDLVRRR